MKSNVSHPITRNPILVAECYIGFQNTNDTGGGGTIGPMVSQRLGCRAIDVGLPHLSMHSIRGITGAADPGLGVHFFEGCFRHYDWARTKVLFQ